jgi:hypothetical protein
MPTSDTGVAATAPTDGVVVRWQVKDFNGPVAMRVIRLDGAAFLFLSSSPPEAGTGGTQTFNTAGPSRRATTSASR